MLKLTSIQQLAVCISYKLASVSILVQTLELLPFWGPIAWLTPAFTFTCRVPTFLDTAHLPSHLILLGGEVLVLFNYACMKVDRECIWNTVRHLLGK